jgi:hypothetical protein
MSSRQVGNQPGLYAAMCAWARRATEQSICVGVRNLELRIGCEEGKGAQRAGLAPTSFLPFLRARLWFLIRNS